MLPPNGAGSSKHSVSIRSNNDDLACTEVPTPVPILVRQERNFRVQRQGRENHDQRRRKPEETKTGQDRSRKSRKKSLPGLDSQNLGSEGLGGGHDRDRTCDPYHVKVVLSR